MLRVGIHGLGFMGMMHYLAYQQIEGVKVVAICEVSEERRRGDWRSIKGNFGPSGTMMDLTGVSTYAESVNLFEDAEVDLVDICLPPGAHSATAVEALNAGKHVVCEKPIALTIEDAEQMVETAKNKNKSFMVAQVLPFFPAYRFVYDSLQSGRFGRLLGGHFDRVISEPVWLKNFYDMKTIGGPLLDLHIHDAHFIRLLFGLPDAVQSVGRLRNDVPEYFNTQFIYQNDNLVVTSTSGVIQQQGRPFMARYEVHFEQATLVLNDAPPTILTADGKVEKANIPEMDEVGIFASELREVTNSLKKQLISQILGSELARDALIIALRERESILQKKTVSTKS
ncbi:MAG: Gfo/Idh/MocA family oxidoreductase [Planctomycetaceae bacterium]|jgi:predicted dehydrogenase|nr:Gfo/Idh/MocA family oxidoreductase [Planctomycetaceae bacterium]